MCLGTSTPVSFFYHITLVPNSLKVFFNYFFVLLSSTLPVILALAMTNKDKEIEDSSRAANQRPDEDRVMAAKKLIQKIVKRPEPRPARKQT